MQIPEHIIDLAELFMKKAKMPGNRRQIKFMIADHIAFIESLGGKITWPHASGPPGPEGAIHHGDNIGPIGEPKT
jgi:hypothetical protein